MDIINTSIGNTRPYGASLCNNGIQFCISYKNADHMMLYLYKNSELIGTINMDEYSVAGYVHSVIVTGVSYEDISYRYELNGKSYVDPYSKYIKKTRKYGLDNKKDQEYLECLVYKDDYEWDGDMPLKLSYSSVISYMLNVRGFTKHPSSGVRAKGTYKGIVEKIPYLNELGINQLILMPAYYYDERDKHIDYKAEVTLLNDGSSIEKINYWGFKEGLYMAPKPEFSYSENSVKEFKDLVNELHKAGIELVMQFYFPDTVNKNSICEMLEFWVEDYHVDGFHILGSNLPIDLIATNSVLADTKIYYERYNLEGFYNPKTSYINNFLAEYNHDSEVDYRRFLKSDEDTVMMYLSRLRANNSIIKSINHITSYDGFTLNDLVSYDYKHNEDNDEDNKDGASYNYSWNCGCEGPSKKLAVQKLRLKQLKNAFTLVMLCQGTPMFVAGDELMNTQLGNNNPYCQDNEITWIKWKLNKQNKELLEYVKQLICIRKNHPVTHMEREVSMLDYKACGYPDMSYHAELAWYPKLDTYIRHIGVMLCGKYARPVDKSEDDFFYYGINMHWEDHRYALPKLPKGVIWETYLSTDNIKSINIAEDENRNLYIDIPARTIVIIKSTEKC